VGKAEIELQIAKQELEKDYVNKLKVVEEEHAVKLVEMRDKFALEKKQLEVYQCFM
jgi:hypothetical protein